MARNTVESAFVALPISQQGFFGPMTNFDTAMLTNNMVTLLLQLRL